MADLAQIRREHVLEALRDLADSPLDALPHPDPDPHPDPVPHRLVRGDREYDVTRVVDRAAELATGSAMGPPPLGAPAGEDDVAEEWLSERDCALLLRGLGFEVVGDGLPPLRWTSATTVGREHAHATWALAARERLLEVASTYGEAIDYHDLAAFVQRRSLVRTTAHPRTWIGDVLGRVAHDCAQRREPLLTALVVDGQGKVGASYATAVEEIRGAAPADVDAHAAQERLDCHRRAGAEMPADGGRPVVLAATKPPRPTRAARQPVSAGPAKPATRAATRAAPAPAKRRVDAGVRRTTEEAVVAHDMPSARTCPVHFTVLPPSGVCDYCE